MRIKDLLEDLLTEWTGRTNKLYLIVSGESPTRHCSVETDQCLCLWVGRSCKSEQKGVSLWGFRLPSFFSKVEGILDNFSAEYRLRSRMWSRKVGKARIVKDHRCHDKSLASYLVVKEKFMNSFAFWKTTLILFWKVIWGRVRLEAGR